MKTIAGYETVLGILWYNYYMLPCVSQVADAEWFHSHKLYAQIILTERTIQALSEDKTVGCPICGEPNHPAPASADAIWCDECCLPFHNPNHIHFENACLLCRQTATDEQDCQECRHDGFSHSLASNNLVKSICYK